MITREQLERVTDAAAGNSLISEDEQEALDAILAELESHPDSVRWIPLTPRPGGKT